MEDKLFAELMESLGEALEHARGKRELRTTVLPDEPRPMSAAEIKNLRDRLQASQAVFARWLNVSPKLVQAWESSQRSPQGPGLLLLRLIEQDPPTVLGTWYQAAGNAKPAIAGKRSVPKRAGGTRRARG